MNKVTAIVDLQFGSTGKGLMAGYWAEKNAPDLICTAWAANAGHTYINAEGRKFVHTMLANGVVSPNLRTILIGPGSLINVASLKREMAECADLLRKVRVLVHENAAVIEDRHIEEEAGPMTAIGSTKKGCGAAAIEKMRRQPGSRILAGKALKRTDLEHMLINNCEYDYLIDKAERILLEGAQGYSLGINSGMWPYTTSRECTIHQLMSDCRIPAYLNPHVIGVARTFPIRVANRYDEQGNMVGFSGPCYPDQKEIDWGDIGVLPEKTTVTKLQRRLFTFSHRQFAEACRMNGVHDVFMNFVNYLPESEQEEFLLKANATAGQMCMSRVRYVGRGATFSDVEETL